MTSVVEEPALALGPHRVWPPVVLAPMAGITNAAFRALCAEHGAGLYVCEMVTTRALVERNPKTLRMITFGPDERPRSLQLYGVDPAVTAAAVRMIADEDLADHVDLNFGCPVPKVTRKGGGAALPWRRRLFEAIVRAAVAAAAPAGIPVTVKMRIGIDADHQTYLDAGRTAEDAGAAWVALHGRTAAQRYSGTADWSAIAALKQALSVPVLGNGDIWEAADALRMMRETGCDGVVVGRGCLGRPWLFADLAAAFEERATRTGVMAEERATRTGVMAEERATRTGVMAEERATRTGVMAEERATRIGVMAGEGPAGAGVAEEGCAGRRLPNLGEVASAMRRHAVLLGRQFGAERDGCVDFRKHVAWYLKGFPVGGDTRRALAMISSLAELDDLLATLDPTVPYPLAELGRPRGRTSSPSRVALPEGWLSDRDALTVPSAAEFDNSGG